MRNRPDPFVKRSTLKHLTQGETPSVRAVALQLHFGMVTALREGDGSIHASWKEVAEWAGVSYASVKRAVIRLRELGWVKELGGHRIVFDYRRSCPVPPAEKAQFEPSPSSIRENPTGKDKHPSEPPALSPAVVPGAPSGGDGLSQEGQERQEAPKVPSGFTEAVGVLVGAGVDRAGAVKALRVAGKAGRVDLEGIRRIVEAVEALPVKPYRPGGLLCAAVARPELGRKLVRDHAAMSRRKAPGSPQVKRDSEPPIHAPVKAVSPWDAAVALVKGWRSLVAEPEDLGFMLSRNPHVTPEAVRVAVPEWSGWL